MKLRERVAAVVAVGVLVGTVPVLPAAAHTTGIHDNCTNLNQRWAHGVGRRRAHDQTTGTPVTRFYRNTDAYRRAIRHNSDLDRDRDGIACEKR